MFSIESFADRFFDGTALRVGYDHPSPGQRLQNDPMPSDYRNQERHRQDACRSAPHKICMAPIIAEINRNRELDLARFTSMSKSPTDTTVDLVIGHVLQPVIADLHGDIHAGDRREVASHRHGELRSEKPCGHAGLI